MLTPALSEVQISIHTVWRQHRRLVWNQNHFAQKKVTTIAVRPFPFARRRVDRISSTRTALTNQDSGAIFLR